MRNAVMLALVACLSAPLAAQDTQTFEIDPYWPKPLPEKWIIESQKGSGGVFARGGRKPLPTPFWGRVLQ